MIIEFVGLPASGKTSVAEVLLRQFEHAGMPAELASVPEARRWWSKLLTALRYRRAFAAAALSLLPDRSRSVLLRARSLRWVLSTLEVYTGDGDKIVVVPEGAIQRALLSFFTPKEEADWERIDRYLESIPVPALVVRLLVTPAQAAERMEARRRSSGKGNLRFLDTGLQLEEVFAQADAFLQSVLDVVKERRGVEVVDLNVNSHVNETLTSAVVPKVQRLVARSS